MTPATSNFTLRDKHSPLGRAEAPPTASGSRGAPPAASPAAPLRRSHRAGPTSPQPGWGLTGDLKPAAPLRRPPPEALAKQRAPRHRPDTARRGRVKPARLSGGTARGASRDGGAAGKQLLPPRQRPRRWGRLAGRAAARARRDPLGQGCRSRRQRAPAAPRGTLGVVVAPRGARWEL